MQVVITRFVPRAVAATTGTSLACGLGLTLGIGNAHAQATHNVDVIVTGEREDDRPAAEKITTGMVDTPQAISTVSARELRDRGVATLSDALRTVPGISLGAGETSWQGNNLVLRGFTTRNDTFLDSLRDYGYYFRDPFASERIEVLKGPSSVLFGRGATGGVIDQVSKEPGLQPIAVGSLALGTDDTRRATIDLGAPLNGTTALRVNVMAHRSDVADRDGALSRRWGVAPVIATGIGTATRLTLSWFHQEERNRPDYGIPWFNGAPAKVDRASFYGFDTDYLDTNVDILTARIAHRLSSAATIDAVLRYSDDRRAFRTSEAAIPAGTAAATPLADITVTRNEFSGYSTDRFLQGQINVTAHVTTGTIGQDIVTGVELGREMPEPVYIFHVGVIPTTLVDPPPQLFTQVGEYVRLRARTHANAIGLYALDTVTLGTRWLAVAGLRWDRFDAHYRSTGFTPTNTVAATTAINRVDAKFSGRASLVYKPVTDGSVYLSYANSFNPSAEGIESLVSAGRSVAQANVNADPETSRIVEAGGKWLIGNRLLLTGSVFEIVKTNVRIPDPLVANANTNGGRQRVRGAELEAAGNITAAWSVHASYTYLDTATTRSDNPTAAGSPRIGEQLPIAPRHSAALQTDYACTEAFQVGGGVLYQSSRLGQNTNASLLRAPGYTVFEARARYRVNPHLALQANVYNLADKLYYDQLHPFHVVPGAGRSALFSVVVTR